MTPKLTPKLRKRDAEERHALDRFRDPLEQFAGDVTRVSPDPPDFLIAHAGRGIAVETTRYHQDSGRKGGSRQAEQEAIEAAVTTMAKAMFEPAHPGVHLMVSAYFMHGNLNRRDQNLYAERLAHAVAGLIPPLTLEPLTTLSASWYQLEAEGLDEVLALLEVSRGPALTYSLWDFGALAF